MHMRNVYLIFTKTHHFCEYGFSVSALWCPLATPTVLLGFLLPWAWSISSQLLQQSAAAAPYLGVSPHRRPSWPSTSLNSFSRPSCAHAVTSHWTWGCSSWPRPLASGVGAWGSSSRRHPWPQTRGSSSWPFLLHRSLALSAIAPDLGRGYNHDRVITHLEPDILECEVKWALESITMNKASWRGWNSSWAIPNPEGWCCESAALNMPANLENSAVATGLENVSFHSNPKERQCQRMLKLWHTCTHLTC